MRAIRESTDKSNEYRKRKITQVWPILIMTFHELKKISRSMDYMEASAFLHKNFSVIGEGAHRKVFQLSDDVIIKIDLPHHIEKTKKYKFKFLKNIYPKAFNSSFTENYMEVAKYQECQKCSVSDFMPKYIGKINMTDSSLLVAWELIKDHDGSPSKELGCNPP